MANNPRAFDPRIREARQQAWLSTPTIAQKYPPVAEITMELQFRLANGAPHAPSHRRIFVPDMQAYFDVQCPERNCVGGGFNLARATDSAVRSADSAIDGVLGCDGRHGGSPCGLTLHYSITAHARGAD